MKDVYFTIEVFDTEWFQYGWNPETYIEALHLASFVVDSMNYTEENVRIWVYGLDTMTLITI